MSVGRYPEQTFSKGLGRIMDEITLLERKYNCSIVFQFFRCSNCDEGFIFYIAVTAKNALGEQWVHTSEAHYPDENGLPLYTLIKDGLHSCEEGVKVIGSIGILDINK